MAAIEIRQAVSTDITEITQLDHSCETTHVFQIDRTSEGGQFEVLLREVRLPRSLRLNYPRDPKKLIDEWTSYTLILVARSGEQVLGYLSILEDPGYNSARVTDLVVLPEVRRKGIATALIQAAKKWEHSRGITRFILEVPSKNKPGVEFSRKLKFEFAGYCDSHYPSLDMVLFFISLSK